jgi:hypothetical protein
MTLGPADWIENSAFDFEAAISAASNLSKKIASRIKRSSKPRQRNGG